MLLSVAFIHFHMEIGCCESSTPVFHLLFQVITLIENDKKAYATKVSC